jgi:hypothetical protein
MSTWCEIVRYRANMKAVFSLTYDQNILPPGKQLDGVMRKQINPKNSLLRHSNFSRLTVQSVGVTPVCRAYVLDSPIEAARRLVGSDKPISQKDVVDYSFRRAALKK